MQFHSAQILLGTKLNSLEGYVDICNYIAMHCTLNFLSAISVNTNHFNALLFALHWNFVNIIR